MGVAHKIAKRRAIVPQLLFRVPQRRARILLYLHCRIVTVSIVGYLLGVLIGLTIGTTGLGGGTITAPALIMVLGLSPVHAVGTALLFSCAARLSAAVSYLWRHQVDFGALGLLLAGGLPGAAVGTMGSRWLTARHSGWGIAVLGSTVIAAAAFSLLRSILQPDRRTHRPRMLPALALPIGLSVGFSSAGAGVLGTVVLFSLTRLTPASVVGTDLVFGFIVALVGGGIHLAIGNCEPVVLAKLIIGGSLGSLAGSSLAGRLPGRTLRSAVLSVAIVLGIILVLKGLEKVV